ncbi:hypothetical protein GCM10010357_58920 [Streptomyces luteireticuli]|uniref:Uncharacterized protein n=1 Tax=Streptomyces luteireticuli TaxID=173858 RepID=A0ABP3IVQ3_9ACTN
MRHPSGFRRQTSARPPVAGATGGRRRGGVAVRMPLPRAGAAQGDCPGGRVPLPHRATHPSG